MRKNNRRGFLADSIKLGIGTAVASAIGPVSLFGSETTKNHEILEFKQVPLGFSFNALEPHIDALTTEIHYTKHHATYIKNVNEAIKTEALSFKDEYDFFNNASRLSTKARNNGGGAWNHNFFWQSLHPNGLEVPSEKLRLAIDKSFGSFESFKEQFSAAALARFGSGWVWLIDQKGTLKIITSPNQDNPLMDDAPAKGNPLLALDLWEHAYYLKYQNRRNEYIGAFWKIINWRNVDKRFI